MILYAFLIATVVQCAYALYFFARIFFTVAKVAPASASNPVSIIVCARNEAQNLEKNLPHILSQKYHNANGKPLYEVIVVNDASTDNTGEVLQQLEQRYEHLWDVIVTPAEKQNAPGKKYALSRGAAHAAHELLLFTDADCMPASDNWLAMMAAPLCSGKEIVAGYGGYYEAPGMLNAFIRWETMHTFLQYSTYARAGIPYMAVGRNMACTKEVLLRAQASAAWSKLPSGDDDLLVSIAGTAQNTAIVSEPGAFTHSDAKSTWRDWTRQKQRHTSTGKYYRRTLKILLGTYALSHALTWLLFFTLLGCGCVSSVLIIMAVRCSLYWAIWAATALKLGERRIIYLFPAFDIGWLIYNFAFFPYIAWKNKKHWT